MSDGVFGCYAGLKRWLVSGAGSFFVRGYVRLWGGRRGEGSTVQAMIGRWVDRASCVRCGGGGIGGRMQAQRRGGGGGRSLEFRLRSPQTISICSTSSTTANCT
jgi:hypothetical protein